MPRFYFDFQDDGALVSDDTGVILPSIVEAKAEASLALAAHGAEVLPGTKPSRIALWIREGKVVVCEVVIAIDFKQLD